MDLLNSALKTQSWKNLANRRACPVCIDANRRHRIMKLGLPSVQQLHHNKCVTNIAFVKLGSLRVRSEAVNAILLSEFLKERHQVQDLKAILAKQEKQIEAPTAGLQKVSAQVEMSRPAPQMVTNDR
jgi:hypothetical protein